MSNVKHLCLVLLLPLTVLGFSAGADEVANAGYSVDLQAGLSSLAAKLEGDGFASDLTADQGLAYGVDLGYGWNNGFRLHLKYNRADGTFDPPASTTPETVDAKRTEYGLYGDMAPFQESRLSGLRLGLGYTIMIYEAEASTPPVVTEQHTQGLMLSAAHDVHFNDHWSLTVKGLLYLPHSFNEKNISTGTNPKYMGRELDLFINWKLREDLKLYLAMLYRQDIVHFDGSSSRGVTGATDTRTTIQYPIGVRFDF